MKRGVLPLVVGCALSAASACLAMQGDVNNDDVIDLADAVYALQVSAGMHPPVVITVLSAGRLWMDRNLGAARAATSSTDTQAYGDSYQWGRLADGHEKINAPTTAVNSSTDVPGHGSFITETESPWDWRVPPNNDLWQGVSGINNPCPAAFRLPTSAELNAERQSWSSDDPAAGAFASPLKLVLAGGRDNESGNLGGAGTYGEYWSSGNQFLWFDNDESSMSRIQARASGRSVRCIKD